MAFEDEFGDWANETVQVETYTATGAWGPQFNTATSVKCWFQYDNRQIVSADGTTVVSDAQMFCDSTRRSIVGVGSRVVLPNDDRVYTVARVRTWPGGDSHVEVFLL